MEILVVVAIMAMLLGITVGFMGDTFGTDIKKSTGRLSAVIQFAYNESITKSVTHRLVFDMNDQAYWLEAGAEGVVVDAEALQSPEERAEPVADEESPDGEAMPPAEGEPALAPPEFSEVDSSVVRRVTFGDSVRIRDVFVAHQTEPASEGRAYLYFFPTGLTEMAVIHLSNEEQTRNFSVIVNPVTGRTRIASEYVEHETLFER